MRFTINLATRTSLDHRLLNRLAFCAIAILVVVSGWNISRLMSLMSEQKRITTEIAAIQSSIGARPNGISETDLSQQKAQIRFYNEIIQRKSIDWLRTLELFENSTPEGVSVSLLAPDKKTDEWKLQGRARSFEIVRKYLEKLDTSENFSNVLLLSHQTVTIDKNMHGIQFTLSCRVVN
ncbi:MAG: PilN domain-containing protein [Desulfuromonadaceae bacterium]|nr:PilN domain-containing protein [Desulfuromonadaceae bacterium]